MGYTVCAPSNTSVNPNSRESIALGFAVSIPPELYGHISPREDLANIDNIDITGGIIDPDLRTEILAVIVNSSQRHFQINAGDLIAQIIFERAATPVIRILSSINVSHATPPISQDTSAYNATSSPPHYPHVIPSDDDTLTLPNQFSPSVVSTVTENKHGNIPYHIPWNIVPDTTSLPSSTPQTRVPPPILLHDKARSAELSTTKIANEKLRNGLGFQSVDCILPHLKFTLKDNFHMSFIEREPVIGLGEISIIDKPVISTNPVPLPHNFGDVLHINIVYGCSLGLNGIKYELFVVDRARQYKLIHDLNPIKTNILPALKAMINDIGYAPGKIVSDFDKKLMGATIPRIYRQHWVQN